MHKKVIFMGSKPIGYHCFAYLLSEKDKLGIQIAGLLTQNRKEFGGENDLSELALANSVPIIEGLDELQECDILYSVQYHEILKADHIRKAKQIAVNLHMAPLPEYRGSNQFSYAIIEDKNEFGTTIHRMDSRIDHGDIIFQKRFDIPRNCWINDLYKLTYDASLNLFKDTLSDIINGTYTPTPQANLESKYGSSLHYRKEIEELKLIDLSWDKEKIERHVRATAMPGFEPPHCIINGQKLYFSKEYK